MSSSSSDRLFRLLAHRLAFVSLPLLTAASLVSEAALYPAAAPPGSAYIRIFNNELTSAHPATVGDKALGTIPSYGASPFVFIAPGQYEMTVGHNRQIADLAGNHYYTAVSDKDGIRLLEQDKFDSQLKAVIYLFNLMDGTTLDLRTTPAGAQVIQAVAPRASGHREVNPTKIGLAVYSGETKLADLQQPAVLERGGIYSLFVSGSASAPRLTWVAGGK